MQIGLLMLRLPEQNYSAYDSYRTRKSACQEVRDCMNHHCSQHNMQVSTVLLLCSFYAMLIAVDL